MSKGLIQATVLACVLVAPRSGAAQADEDEAWLAGEEGEEEGVPLEEGVAEGGEAEPAGEDDAWLEGKEVQEVEAPEEDTTYTLKELPKKWYFGIGGRTGYFAVPGGVIEWFPVELAPTAHGYQVGIEGVFRRDGLSIVPHLTFAQVIGEGPFQEDGDPDEDVEWWDINLKILMIGVDFYGSVRIKDWVYYYYGAGISAMFRLGKKPRDDMIRNEAYREDGWHPCDGPGPPYPGGNAGYCESSGGHYDQNWKGWGADPFYPYVHVIPLGFRFKPIPNLYANFQAGLILPMLPVLSIRAGYLF